VRWILGLTALAMMAAAFFVTAQEQHDARAGKRQYVVLLKRGPKWIANKSAAEQPLLEHGRYLNQQMQKGALQIAGPFLDGSGGLIVFNAADEAEARAIEEHDPGVMSQILEIESIRPFLLAFDAATGKTPFESQK
jgi:uncharacterized protein